MMPPKLKTSPSSPGALGTPAAAFPLASPTPALQSAVQERSLFRGERITYFFPWKCTDRRGQALGNSPVAHGAPASTFCCRAQLCNSEPISAPEIAFPLRKVKPAFWNVHPPC